MTLSLNEVEALAKKATRGAGYPWGLAEEAAKATRWLCGRGVDGCDALAGLLTACDSVDPAGRTLELGDVWTGKDGTLCPIIAGATLSDMADTLSSVRLGNVLHPLLLVPFAGLAAGHLNTTIELAWVGTVARTDGEGLGVWGSRDTRLADVTVIRRGDVAAPRPRSTRAAPAVFALEKLEAFAHRTYAPATEESRRRGAGAGLSDND